MADVEGFREDPAQHRYVSLNWVAPKYFQTLGTPLLAGRDFTFNDKEHAPVAIINRAMARHYFGENNPLERHVKLDGDDNRYEIVGVAGDAKYLELRETAPPTIYLNAFNRLDCSLISYFELWLSRGL